MTSCGGVGGGAVEGGGPGDPSTADQSTLPEVAELVEALEEFLVTTITFPAGSIAVSAGCVPTRPSTTRTLCSRDTCNERPAIIGRRRRQRSAQSAANVGPLTMMSSLIDQDAFGHRVQAYERLLHTIAPAELIFQPLSPANQSVPKTMVFPFESAPRLSSLAGRR